jgi:tetratricopeptide (TPR) repeat protein
MKQATLLSALLFCASLNAAKASDCENAKILIEKGAQEEKLRKRIELFKQAVDLCPEADAPHFYYGLALEEQEDQRSGQAGYSSAETEYRKILAINPKHAGALFKLAGIEYVTLRFDSAQSHYTLFLALEKPDGKNAELITAAQNLRAKSRWLAQLPQGAIQKGALTKDKDRFAGLPNMLGRMAFEVGRAAMQVTGKLGFGLAGAGVMLAARALGNKEINLKKIEKARDAGNYSEMLSLSLDKLPDAVNKKGINSEEVFILLVFANRSLVQQPDKIEGHLPFFEGLLATQKDFLQPLPVGGKKTMTYGYLMDFAVANEVLGNEALQNKQYLDSYARFIAAERLYSQYGGTFENGQKIKTEDDKVFGGMQVKYRLLSAQPAAQIDSLRSESLLSLEDGFEHLQNDDYLGGIPQLWSKLMDGLMAWGITAASMDHTSNIKDYVKYKNIIGQYPRDRLKSGEGAELNGCLGNVARLWGEHCQALRLIEPLGEKATHLGDLPKYWITDLYNTTFMVDSSAKLLKKWGSTSMPKTKYAAQLSLIRRLLILGRTADAIPLIAACKVQEVNDLSLRKQSLLPATALSWIMFESDKPEAHAILEQLHTHWRSQTQAAPQKSPRDMTTLLRGMVLPTQYNPQKKVLFDRMMALCLENAACSDLSQSDLKNNYLIIAQEWGKARDSYSNALKEVGKSDTTGNRSKSAIFQEKKAHLAILYHETGDFAKAIEIRRALLKSLLPHEETLPENTADMKVRLAESLAAMGHKEEALKLLEEANNVFAQFSATKRTIRHQRAHTALQKLKGGKKDIAMHGLLALEFIR